MPKHQWEEGNRVIIGIFYLTMVHLDSEEKIELKKVSILIAIYLPVVLTLVR